MNINKKVNPVFELDTHSITVCKNHSKYKKILDKFESDPNPNFQFNPLFIKFIPGLYGHCKTCNHYIDNDCYFSMDEIDEIYKSHGYVFTLFFNKNICKLCGLKVRNVFNTMRNRYLNETNERSIPLICSNCSFDIKRGKIGKKISTVILINLSLLAPAIIYITLLNILAFNSLDATFITLTLVFTIPFGVIIFFLLKRLIKLITYKTLLKCFTQSELLG